MELPAARDLVSRLFRVIDARQFDRLGEVFTPDAVYHRPGYDPLVGLPELTHFYREVRVIAAGGHAVDQVVAGDGVAACWGTFRGADRAGKVLDEPSCDTYAVRDDRIAVRRTYFFRPAI